MPFEPDANLAFPSGGGSFKDYNLMDQSTYQQPAGFQADPTLEMSKRAQRAASFLGRIGKAVVQPAINYGEMLGEGAMQAGRAIMEPWRLKPLVGQQYTPEEASRILTNKKSFLMTEPEIEKFRTPGAGLLEGAKRTAGMEAYFAPALIAPAAGGGLAYAGGQGVLQALGAGAGIGATQGLAVGAARGALAGGLSGFGQSQEGQEIGSTLAGTAGGAAVGGLLGAIGGRMTEKALRNQQIKQQLLQEKNVYPVDRTAASSYKRIFRISKRNATRDIDPQRIAEDLLREGAPTEKSLESLATRAQMITGRNGELAGQNGIITQYVDDVMKQADDLVPVDGAIKAAQDQLVGKPGITAKDINEVTQTIMNSTPQASIDTSIRRALTTGAGIGPDDVDDVLVIARNSQLASPNAANQTEALVDGLYKAGFSKEQTDNIMSVITNYRPTRGTIGQANASQALKLERELGDIYGLLKRSAVQSGDPRTQWKANAYAAAMRNLSESIDDNMTGKTEAMRQLLTQDKINALNALVPGNEWTPPLGDRLANHVFNSSNPSIAYARALQRPWVNALKAVYETTNYSPALLDQTAQQAASRMAGAVLGLSYGNPLTAIFGYTVAPIIEPTLSAVSERLMVPTTTGAARLIERLAHGGVRAGISGAKGAVQSGMSRVGAAGLTYPTVETARELFTREAPPSKPLNIPDRYSNLYNIPQNYGAIPGIPGY